MKSWSWHQFFGKNIPQELWGKTYRTLFTLSWMNCVATWHNLTTDRWWLKYGQSWGFPIRNQLQNSRKSRLVWRTSSLQIFKGISPWVSFSKNASCFQVVFKNTYMMLVSCSKYMHISVHIYIYIYIYKYIYIYMYICDRLYTWNPLKSHQPS